jgi:aminoglycoside/choline kinase family phosphotransferase
MDAPPPLEDVGPFVQVANILRAAGVNVPIVHAVDRDNGFALLSDLGNSRYRDELAAETADRLYGDAMSALVTFQRAVDIQSCGRPLYGETLLRRELNLFREWFLERALGIELDAEESSLLEWTWSRLIASALEQPQVFVHRDYHSRNLMVCEARNPGILDFQDAVVGPITYDLVSLLRDCYISWPECWVDRWVDRYLELAARCDLVTPAEASRFRVWFDLMGLQRHLKAVGIFARLKLRDDKRGYLADIPRTLGYIKEASRRYPEFSGFTAFLDDVVLVRLAEEALA